MHDEQNTREQLVQEVEALRRQVAELEKELEPAAERMAAREHAERYRIVSELVSDYAYAFRVEEDGSLVGEWVTEAFEQMTGYTPAELPSGESWNRIFYPDDLPLVQQHVQTLLGGRPSVQEFRIVTKDGRVRWVRDHGRPIWDEAEARIGRVYGAVQDITVDKEAEAMAGRYKQILSATPDTVALVSQDYVYREVNASYMKRMGRDYDDIVGHPVAEIMGRDVFETLLKGYLDACLAGEKVRYQAWFDFEEAGHRFVDVTYSPYRDREGTVAGALVSARDITDLERAQEALRELTHFNQEIIAGAHEGIIVYDCELNYRVWNRFMEEMTGLKAQEVLGQNAFDVFPHLHEQGIDRLLQRALAGETVQSPDTPFYVPDSGKAGWVSGIYGPQYSTSGEIIGVIGLLRDVTERKQAETKLEQQAAQLFLLNEVGNEIAAMQRVDDVLEKATQLVESRFGYHHVAVFTLDEEQEALIMKAKAGAFADLFPRKHRLEPGQGMVGWAGHHGKTLLANDVTADARYVNLYPDVVLTQSELCVPIRVGERVLGVLDVQSPQRDAFGENDVLVMETLASQIAVAMDNAQLYESLQQELDERQRVQVALRESQAQLRRHAEKLERSNQELENFAYVASHDLKEPLRMVTSYLTLLKQRCGDQLDDKARDFVGYATDGAKRMQEMIQALLDLSRVSTQARAPKPVDCEALLERVQRNLQLRIEESGARVSHDPLPTVAADGMQLAQVFQNLIDNAIKFRRDEPPRVHISAERQADEWVFAVSDNGTGLDPAQADLAFALFQRLHNQQTYPGLGIGLALCKKIVERHDGRLWVESLPGQGATFYFTIPA